MAASSAPRSPGAIALADDGGERRRPHQRLVGGAAVVLLIVAVAVAVVLRDGSSNGDRRLHDAIRLMDDDDNFATATESGVTFTKVSTDLEAEGDRCKPRTDGTARCDALYAAAGFARVSAVAVLRCTRPGVYDARRAMRTYLEALAKDDRASPAVPSVTTCG